MATENSTTLETGGRKRNRASTNLDYEQGSPSPGSLGSGSSECVGDFATVECGSEESSNRPETEPCELDEFLDKLYVHLPQTQDDPSPSISRWNEHYNDIGNYFKMKRCSVTPDLFLASYLFGGKVELYNVMKLHSAKRMEPLLNYLDQFTSLDYTEEQLFLSRQFPDALTQEMYRNIVFEEIQTETKIIIKNSSHLLHGATKLSDRGIEMAKCLEVNVKNFMARIADTLRMHPSEVSVSAYKDIFKLYLHMFGLASYSGDHVKLGIPYRNRQVISVPDILVRKDPFPSQYCAVVEVKRMILDPTLKHAFQNKGILSKSDEGPKPPKIKRVNFNSEGASTVEQSDEKDTDDGDQRAFEIGESPVSESQRKFLKLFFGQLFGSVLALDCYYHQDPRAHLPRLGIGVVGFRVVFFSFRSRPAVPFKDVTQDAENHMDVYMTSELSLLKASDRRKINEILLAVSENEPQPVTD